MRRGVLPVLVAGVLAGGLGACATTPTAAPLHDAKILNDTTGNISTACGEAYQLAAFPAAPRQDILTLEATASTAAWKLAQVYRRNPSWFYQGETVGQIISDTNAMLGSCGLHRAQRTLQRAIKP
jgi:hypothetical protein